MLNLEVELRELAVELRKEYIPYALIGELALTLYTCPRPTYDIDLIIDPEDWELCIQALKPLGIESIVGPRKFQNIEIRRLTKKFPRSTESLAIDFLLANTPELIEVLKNRLSVAWKDTTLYYANLEGLIYTRRLRGTKQDLQEVELLLNRDII